jgi:methyl-accepting chemotaxis protein
LPGGNDGPTVNAANTRLTSASFAHGTPAAMVASSAASSEVRVAEATMAATAPDCNSDSLMATVGVAACSCRSNLDWNRRPLSIPSISSDTFAEASDRVAGKSDRVAEASGRVAEASDTIAEASDTVAEASDTVAEASGRVAGQSDRVAEASDRSR